MGQRMPDEPIEYDNDCVLKFPAGKTPKYVYARFINLVKCPAAALLPPNDRLFKLTQQPGVPCMWRYVTAPWTITFEFLTFPVATRLFILHPATGDMYFNDTTNMYEDEGFVFTNEYAACGLQVGAIGGIAVITWSPQATELLEAINMRKANDLFMELFPLADGKLVYKFCRLQDATNVKILFEP